MTRMVDLNVVLALVEEHLGSTDKCQWCNLDLRCFTNALAALESTSPAAPCACGSPNDPSASHSVLACVGENSAVGVLPKPAVEPTKCSCGDNLREGWHTRDVCGVGGSRYAAMPAVPKCDGSGWVQNMDRNLGVSFTDPCPGCVNCNPRCNGHGHIANNNETPDAFDWCPGCKACSGDPHASR